MRDSDLRRHGYQHTLRATHGWFDLPERIERLELLVEQERELDAHVAELQQHWQSDQDWEQRGVKLLLELLRPNPRNDTLLYACIQQTQRWLQPQQWYPERVAHLLEQTLLWCQGPRRDELRRLQQVVRVIGGIEKQIAKRKWEQVAELALHITLVDPSPIGRQTLRWRFEALLQLLVSEGEWPPIQQIWKVLERLATSPAQIEQLYASYWTPALEVVLRARQLEGTAWLWQRALIYYPAEAQFWQSPPHPLKDWVERAQKQARSRNVSDSAADFDRAYQDLESVKDILKIFPEHTSVWRNPMQDGLCVLQQSLRQVSALVGDLVAERHKDDREVIQIVVRIREIDLDWSVPAGRRSWIELIEERKMRYMSRVQEKINAMSSEKKNIKDIEEYLVMVNGIASLYREILDVSEIWDDETLVWVKKKLSDVIMEVERNEKAKDGILELMGMIRDFSQYVEFGERTQLLYRIYEKRQTIIKDHRLINSGVLGNIDNLIKECVESDYPLACQRLVEFFEFMLLRTDSRKIYQLISVAEQLVSDESRSALLRIKTRLRHIQRF